MFAFCIFLTVYPYMFFVFLLLHYLVMLVWVISMKTNFCGSIDGIRRPLSEFIYNIVLAFVLIGDIIHVNDGPTRLKNLLYYLLIGAEHAVLMTFWYLKTNSNTAALDSWGHQTWYQIMVMVWVPSSYILGIFFLIVYYRRFHPDGQMPITNTKASLL